jgi:signal transduction histidine kinase
VAVRTWLSEHPGAADTVLALALALLVAFEVVDSDVVTPVALGLAAGAAPALTLAWRRRVPLLPCVAVLGASAVIGAQAGGGLTPQTLLVTVAVACYSVAAFGTQRQARAGLAVVLAGVLAAEPGDVVVQWPLYAGIWAAGRLVRRYRELAETLERERAEHARLAIVEERARISRELHDVVAHSVSTMVVQAGAERLAVQDERPETAEVLAGIEDTGREALAEMRRLLGMLRRDGDELALAPQPSLAHLEALAVRMGRAGLPTTIEVQGEPLRLPPGIDLAAYRIVQEALTNALKHSRGTQARVLVRYEPGAVELEIVDDGIPQTAGAGGHGLAGMRERVALYGGRLDAGPRPGGGYAVSAQLPIELP